MRSYDDIVATEWPRTSLRPKMALSQRAKIFLPFAALTGYDKALNQRLETSISESEQKKGSICFEEIWSSENF